MWRRGFFIGVVIGAGWILLFRYLVEAVTKGSFIVNSLALLPKTPIEGVAYVIILLILGLQFSRPENGGATAILYSSIAPMFVAKGFIELSAWAFGIDPGSNAMGVFQMPAGIHGGAEALRFMLGGFFLFWIQNRTGLYFLRNWSS